MDSSAASGSSEFARNLGSRVDALESALNALAAGEHDAAGVVRELCESLALQARAAGFPRIHEQAQDLLTVESALLSRHGAGLVSLLRREATRHGTAQRMCLALNLTAATALALQDRVRSWGVQVHPLQTLRDLSALPGNTAPDAVIMARGEDPDHDMAMLAAVRARRHGADVPVLAIGEGPLPVASSNRLTVMQGVQFVQGPPDPSFIAGWIVECLMHLDTHAGEPLLWSARKGNAEIVEQGAGVVGVHPVDHVRC